MGSPKAKNPKEERFPEGLRQLSGEKENLGININEMGRDAAALPDPAAPDYRGALTTAAESPVLTRHIAEAIGYRSLDRASYGKVF